MGFAICHAECFGCRRIFGFNPHRVPSIPIKTVGETIDRRPICADCVERVNPLRIKNGLQPIVPLPGAYEPLDETEL